MMTLSTLTGDQLRARLNKLGWTQVEFANFLKLTETTVSSWVNDRSPIPYYAEAYIELAEKYIKLYQKRG